MNIKILGTGCPKCKKLEDNTRKAVEELGIDAEIKKITDIAEITKYNILMAPALVLDEKVLFSGRVNSVEEIKKILS